MTGELTLSPRVRGSVWIAAVMLNVLAFRPGVVQAQDESRAVPKRDYFVALSLYYEGEFGTALNGFRSAARSGIRSSEGRWVDSICYHTMMGECYYQMGEPTLALERFNAALELFLVHRDWLLRVQFPPTISAMAPGARQVPTWGASNRRSKIGMFPDKMASLQGDANVEQAVRQGGVVSPQHLFPLHVGEIVRCQALAQRRRTELMGPTCEHDRLTDQLLVALSRRPAPPNHWSQAWISVLLGLAYAADGKDAQAIGELQRGLQVAGEFDHALTGAALLELGKLAMRQDKLKLAGTFFHEATLASAPFSEFGVMEEAFRWGTVVHLIGDPSGVHPPLAPAILWSHRHSRFLEASLMVQSVENFAAMRDTSRAASLLNRVQRTVVRSEMGTSNLGARFQHQAALVSYQQGNVSAGGEALARAVELQRKGSPTLFQIGLSDKLFKSGLISQRIAAELYAKVLREPTPDDWNTEPLDTLVRVLTPYPLPLEHWFEVTLLRKEVDKALEISDRARRHRFYASLPLGGRLLALRWVLAAPPEALDQQAKLQRQDLGVKFPHYVQLARQAGQIRGELSELPIQPVMEEDIRRQSDLFKALAKVSASQEIVLREMALQRQASEFVFPPFRTVPEIQEQLPEGQLVLSFFATSRALYGFALSNSRYTHWKIESPTDVRNDVVEMLRRMGHHEKNLALGLKDLQSDSWKEPARRLLLELTRAKDNTWKEFDELIVVPDGVLWYLPFEALPLGAEHRLEPLISQLRIRYAPTVSLAIPDGRRPKPLANTGLVAGRLFPRDREDVAQQASEDIQNVLPGSVPLAATLPVASGLYSHLFGRLLVLNDLEDTQRGPYDWSPLSIDRSRPGSSLASWFTLPWGAPEQVLLPGFHTPAENGLKQGGDGSEVFLAVCGLMSTGTRSILLSRWRPGGQTSFELVREFAQELPHAYASRAWQRSVRLAMRTEVDPEREPRIHPYVSDISVKADHPFFWSAYMLVDTGAAPPGVTCRNLSSVSTTDSAWG